MLNICTLKYRKEIIIASVNDFHIINKYNLYTDEKY